jgi:hypothetical protein
MLPNRDREGVGAFDFFTASSIRGSETKQVRLGFRSELAGFIQIHCAARNLHRQNVFF